MGGDFLDLFFGWVGGTGGGSENKQQQRQKQNTGVLGYAQNDKLGGCRMTNFVGEC